MDRESPGPGRLVPLRTVPRSGHARRQRAPTHTHRLGDLGSLFTSHATASGGGKRIRVCVVDTILQTGGAEWFATQLAVHANPALFEFVIVTWDSTHSTLTERLNRSQIKVVNATSWHHAGLTYQSWRQEGLFEMLDRLSPDVVFFSSQYLFEALPAERLSAYPVVVRISNFHADRLAETDFTPAAKIVCCTEEQLTLTARRHADKTTLISTGVDTALFQPAAPDDKEALKRRHGLEGKTVVLFVARLGDPLKRTPVFQDVVRAVTAERDDVAFVVVGYFETHNNEDEAAFGDFVAEHGLVWKEGAPPWEMPDFFRMADILLSTSGPHEGLSNTVLQALATGAVPVVTDSAGMHELVEQGETGFLVEDGDAPAIAEALIEAVDSGASARGRLAANGRARVTERYRFAECAAAYQRVFLSLFRSRPARICITDGLFGIGGAEWLAAQLMTNSRPEELRFEVVVHRSESPLLEWLETRGVPVHRAPPMMSYGDWLRHGTQEVFSRLRPDIVMPCTITTWPGHDPFYRLLIISQNASDAAVLSEQHFEQADYFMCVSEDVKGRLSPPHHWKMMVLHNSIDVDMFRPDCEARRRVRERLGIPADAQVILWSGRMHEARKRLDVLMDVIHGMRDDASVHFLVVGYFRGDEGDRDGWADFMAEHRNVSWIPDAPPWEAPDHYSAADVYLSTSGFTRSDFEGLSVATVQALAARLPVVSTLSGGQQEIVDHGVNGWLVDPGDVDGLVAALRRAATADPRDLEEIGARNRAKAEQRFDIKHHARVYSGVARVLKNTVGPALTADPALPTPAYRFRDEATALDAQIRRAASFLTYTWPLLPAGELPADASEQVVVLADGDKAGRRDLHAAQAALQPGGWLVVPNVGRDHRDGCRDELSATRIGAVLDFLELAFPGIAACERRGPDLIMRKRTGATG